MSARKMGNVRNLRVGWVLIQGTWLTWMQGRAFFFLLAFGWMIPPLIALFVWFTAAEGKSIGGLTQGEFVAYYLLYILVNQLTYAQTHWTVGGTIRDGLMNILLLRPLSPVFHTLATEVAGKVVYMAFVTPITLILAFVLHPTFHLTIGRSFAFLGALLLAWLLRFFWGYWLALLAFWTTRADALLSLQDACVFLLAGQVAPVNLLPGPLALLAKILPFRYMAGFPVEIATGHLGLGEIGTGFAYQVGWLCVALTLFAVIWHRGIRHYSAIGG